MLSWEPEAEESLGDDAGLFSRVARVVSELPSSEVSGAVGSSSLATRRPVPTTPKGGLQRISISGWNLLTTTKSGSSKGK